MNRQSLDELQIPGIRLRKLNEGIGASELEIINSGHAEDLRIPGIHGSRRQEAVDDEPLFSRAWRERRRRRS